MKDKKKKRTDNDMFSAMFGGPSSGFMGGNFGGMNEADMLGEILGLSGKDANNLYGNFEEMMNEMMGQGTKKPKKKGKK